MQDVSSTRSGMTALAQALYPWFTNPSVRLVWYSRVVYALCVAVAAFGHKECLMISELVGIQLFFSLIGMSGGSRHSLNSHLLGTLAGVAFGVAFSALLTFGLFCFEGVARLVIFVDGGAVQHDYVFYMSPVIFAVLIVTWLLATRKMQNRTKPAAD